MSRPLADDPLLHLVDRVYEGAVNPKAWQGILEGAVVLDEELVPQREFEQAVIYKELLGPVGIGRICAGVVFGLDSRDMPATICGVYRAITDPPFGERERGLMRQLVPHLSRAIGVMYRLRDGEMKVAANLAALDRLATGVVLLGGKGEVLHANKRAKALLEENDGLDFRAPALEAPLGSVLRADVLDVPHFSARVQLPRPSGRRPLVLQLAPLPQSHGFSGASGLPRAIAFIAEQDRSVALDPEALQKLYGATPAEARLAGRLCAGDTVAGIAAQQGIAEQTARTQLQGLFEKTGTHRQADLVRLLVSLAWEKA